MSKINPKQAYAKEIIDHFEGVGEALTAEQTHTASIVNFRILSDGSLEKRNGWRVHSTVPDDQILGVWQGSIKGEYLFIIVTRDEIYRVENGILHVTSTVPYGLTERVSLFAYREHLYLIDGISIRVWRSETGRFEEAHGYVPLVGIGWHPRTMGKTNEPLNLLCNSVRVHYTNSSGETVYHLPLIASRIDRVTVDGVETNNYVFNNPTNQLVVNALGTSVEIAFSFHATSLHRTNLFQSTLAFADFFGAKEKLLLSGSEKGQLVYAAREVSDTMMTASNGIYRDSDPLYFSESDILIVGDLSHPTTAFFRHRDRVLALSSLSLFSIELSTVDDAAYVRPLHCEVGMLAHGQNVRAAGDPILCNENGVFLLHAPPNDPDNLIAQHISERIPELESEEFAKNAVIGFDPVHNEIWIRNAAAKNGTVWVYGLSTKKWYCFDGILANGFCSIDGRLCFYTDDQLCVFEDTLTTDGGVPFVSTYETSYLSLSEPELSKRGLRVSVKAEHQGNQLSLWLESETRRRTIPLSAPVQDAPTLFDRRAAMGRFHFLRVTIRDRGYSRSRIYRLGLYANL